MQDKLEALEKLSNQYYTESQRLQEEILTSFKQLLKTEYFDKYPWINDISWDQGVPAFNDDGDPCYFSASPDTLRINGYSIYDEEDFEEYFDKSVNQELVTTVGNELIKLVDRIPSSVLESLDADYESATITREELESI